MPPGPEDIARTQIDRMLEQAGWAVQDVEAANRVNREKRQKQQPRDARVTSKGSDGNKSTSQA